MSRSMFSGWPAIKSRIKFVHESLTSPVEGREVPGKYLSLFRVQYDHSLAIESFRRVGAPLSSGSAIYLAAKVWPYPRRANIATSLRLTALRQCRRRSAPPAAAWPVPAFPPAPVRHRRRCPSTVVITSSSTPLACSSAANALALCPFAAWTEPIVRREVGVIHQARAASRSNTRLPMSSG